MFCHSVKLFILYFKVGISWSQYDRSEYSDYNIEMKKHQSEAQKQISLHYFGVYPIQIQFIEQIPEDTRLYFQKDLQIIAKFPIASIAKSQQKIVVFSQQLQIHHFRTFSDKNLNYQWSLYFGIENEQKKDQLHIQSQKFCLGEWWKCFIQTRQSIFELRVQFKTIKANLTFLLAICKSSQDLVVRLHNHITSMSEKSEQESFIKNKIIEEEHIPKQQKTFTIPRQTLQSANLISEATLLGDLVKIKQYELEKQFSNLETDIKLKQQISQSLLDGLPQNQLRLTHSEIALSQAIEQDLRQSENQKQKPIIISVKTLEPPKLQHHISIKRTQSMILMDSQASKCFQISKKKCIFAGFAILVLMLCILGLYFYHKSSPLIVPKTQQNYPNLEVLEQQPKIKTKKMKRPKKGK